MKRLLAYLFLVLVLTFSLQSWTHAEDITEFEIDGISVGDNLFDHYSKKEIKEGRLYEYKDSKFVGLQLNTKKSSEYDVLKFHYNQIDYEKSKKKLLIVDSVIGALFYPNIKNCYLKKDEIVADIENSLTNFTKDYEGTYKASEDITGKSTMTSVIFASDSGEIGVTCTHYAKEFKNKKNYENNLRVDISSKEFSKWLKYEAYK